MKRAILILVGIVLFTGIASAEVPHLIRYQGYITDKNDPPQGLNGSYAMNFTLYDAETGGSSIWNEAYDTDNKVDISEGQFSVLLGTINDTLEGVDWSQDLWISIEVDGEEMNERQRITSVPTAIYSDKAELAVNAEFAEEARTVAGDSLYVDAATGYVGIGTTSPQAPLEVTTSESGGLDSNNVLLLHCNDEGDPDTFIDETGKDVLVTGAQIVTDPDRPLFGGASGLFDGDNDYLIIADSEDWNFGNGDFTIDLWVKLNGSSTGYGIFMTQYQGAYDFWELRINYDTGLVAFNVFSNESQVVYLESSEVMGAGWHHLAVVRLANTYTLFLDGTKTAEAIGYSAMPNLSGDLYIGMTSSYQRFINARLDEIRISKGAARWENNFTPPNAEYAHTVAAIFSGKVRANEFITFGQSEGKQRSSVSWKIFGKDDGMYLESLESGRTYKILTEEVTP